MGDSLSRRAAAVKCMLMDESHIAGPRVYPYQRCQRAPVTRTAAGASGANMSDNTAQHIPVTWQQLQTFRPNPARIVPNVGCSCRRQLCHLTHRDVAGL